MGSKKDEGEEVCALIAVDDMIVSTTRPLLVENDTHSNSIKCVYALAVEQTSHGINCSRTTVAI